MRGWHTRTERARRAGAKDLASRATAHLEGLMQQGRRLWGDLEDLSRRFKEVDQQLEAVIQQQKKAQPADLDKDWAQFEAEQELEQLRRRSGFNA